MPINPATGKTSRRQYTEAEYLEFRIEQAKAKQGSRPAPSASKIKKGKQRARNSPDAGNSEGSGPAQTPLLVIAGLDRMRLDSGGSSAANTPAGTPADTPATLPHPPIPEKRAPALPSAPKTRNPSKPSAGMSAKLPEEAPAQYLTDVGLEVPDASQLLKPAIPQVGRSRSDDGSNAARISALEQRLDRMEKRISELDLKLKKLG